MGIYLVENGKYQCCDLIEEHNHILHLPTTTHMMRSQRKIADTLTYEIDLADDSGIKPKSIFEYIARQAGEREKLGYTVQDKKNYLRTKRKRGLLYGEAGSLLKFFENQVRVNPSFTFSVQLDSDELITNIFWADPKMIIDYAQFGDVVSFDTTFCTNKEYIPFGVFTGFNHHRRATIFGVALLYDETAKSFKWLFEVFAKAHRQKKPITIFTDQDAAMAKALDEVWPETWHGLCTWHLMRNEITHLGHLMDKGSSFLRDLKRCIFYYEEELKFEDAWKKLVSDYKLGNSSWMQHIYGLKFKWAKCYMKNTLTLGMRSTQLSESFNSDLKDYLKSSFDVVQFFNHFERVLKVKRDLELKDEFESREKQPRNMFHLSPTVKQAAKIYTPSIFEKFQKQFNWASVCNIKFKNETNPMSEYLVGIVGSESEFKVCCNRYEHVVNCSCKKFETFGILCCHCLKVLIVLDIKCIPEAYLLRRWTRMPGSSVVEGNDEKQVEEDMNLDRIQRYKRLCPELIELAEQASNSAKGYDIVKRLATEARKQLESMVGADSPQVLISNEVPHATNAKGLKKKEPCKGGKRKKGWFENPGKGKKMGEKSKTQDPQQPQSAPPPSTASSMWNLQLAHPHSNIFPMWNLSESERLQLMSPNFTFNSPIMRTSDHALSQQLSSQASTPFMRHFLQQG